MKNRFYVWLESMGQEPRRIFWDLIFCVAKFYFLTCLVVLPTFLFAPLIFPQIPAGTPKPVKMPSNFILPMMIMGVYMFVAVITALSFMGGWRRLVAKFSAPKKFSEGQLFKRQSGAIGGMNYNNILHIRISDSGLYLKCIFPFNLFQRPILIPWKEIKAINDVRVLFGKSTFIIVGSPKISSVILQNKKLVSQIRAKWEAKH